MIIVKLMGGLGNQLFQYATGRAMADHLQTDLKLDLSWFANPDGAINRPYALSVFNIRATEATSAELRKFQVNKLRRRLGWYKRGYVKEKQNNKFDPNLFQLPAGQDYYLDGYWQTAKYFQADRPAILTDLTVKISASSRNQGLAEIMAKTASVSLHVRRGDYVSNPETFRIHGVCSLEYYQQAITLISAQVEQPHFFIFSDDVAWVKANMIIAGSVTYVEDNQAERSYEDLRLMSLCRHNIVANSSFSWWGAWLNRYQDKIVVAPHLWFNDARLNDNDIIPADWLKI